MKREPSDKPAAKPTLALFIALLYHPGIGWTPKTHGAVFPAGGLSRVAFSAAAPSVNGGRGRGFTIKGGAGLSPRATPTFICRGVGQ